MAFGFVRIETANMLNTCYSCGAYRVDKIIDPQGPEFLETHIQLNQWFKENADKVTPAVDLLDTSQASPEETAQRVADWVQRKLRQSSVGVG